MVTPVPQRSSIDPSLMITPSTNHVSQRNYHQKLFQNSPTSKLEIDERLACNNPNKRAKVLTVHKDGTTELTKFRRIRRLLVSNQP